MLVSDQEKNPSTSDLKRLAIEYFTRKGYRVEENVSFEGIRGAPINFDLLIHKGDVTQGVWIKDWNRTVGINVAINIDKASEDVGLSNPIIIGEKFSDHAKAYANRRRILLLTKRDIMQHLK